MRKPAIKSLKKNKQLMKCKNMKLENMSCLNVDSVLDHLDSLNVKK